jgi:hypothetical protein
VPLRFFGTEFRVPTQILWSVFKAVPDEFSEPNFRVPDELSGLSRDAFWADLDCQDQNEMQGGIWGVRPRSCIHMFPVEKARSLLLPALK